MTDLELISRKASELELGFLLIGGLAVIEHGFTRLTTDIDLIVRRREANRWKNLLTGLGYCLINEQESFHQYERADTASWPLDLMLANEPTYEGLTVASLEVQVMGAPVRMVSLKHLIALKLHVLKQKKLHRFLDDIIDVVELVKANRLDLQSPDFRALFFRYGNAEIYEKVRLLVEAK